MAHCIIITHTMHTCSHCYTHTHTHILCISHTSVYTTWSAGRGGLGFFGFSAADAVDGDARIKAGKAHTHSHTHIFMCMCMYICSCTLYYTTPHYTALPYPTPYPTPPHITLHRLDRLAKKEEHEAADLEMTGIASDQKANSNVNTPLQKPPKRAGIAGKDCSSVCS
jgi:hypothetical protein